jgi:DNA invertase Pin-like site-specific DNA recombinase
LSTIPRRWKSRKKVRFRDRQRIEPLGAQLEQRRGAGCTKGYREKVTGAHSDRRELLKLLNSLTAGDTVTGTRIDRLARNAGHRTCLDLIRQATAAYSLGVSIPRARYSEWQMVRYSVANPCRSN